MVERVRAVTFDGQFADTKVPGRYFGEVRDQLATIAGWYGSDVVAEPAGAESFGTMPYEEAPAAGMRLFSEQVVPGIGRRGGMTGDALCPAPEVP